ncbi:MAG: hypothetical protein ACRDPO_03125 [Streptosporangiaceae bacterium]
MARDDPDEVIAAVEALDLGRLSRTEPGRLAFWPAYANALVRVGRAEAAEPVLARFEELARARQRQSALAAAASTAGPRSPPRWAITPLIALSVAGPIAGRITR